MTELEEKIKTIQGKLQQVLKQYSVLEKENQRLEKELLKGSDQINQQHATIELLKQQLEINKANAGNLNERDRKEFEKRINSYVKEIDRCITLLSE